MLSLGADCRVLSATFKSKNPAHLIQQALGPHVAGGKNGEGGNQQQRRNDRQRENDYSQSQKSPTCYFDPKIPEPRCHPQR